MHKQTKNLSQNVRVGSSSCQYRNHFQRYALYWHRFSKSAWQEEQTRLTEAAQQQKERDARTLDRVKIGDAASEAAHTLQSLRSETGEGPSSAVLDSHWRDARDGGWFSYTLKSAAPLPLTLHLTYWGPGSRGSHL